jgi:hypothetical protein
MTASGHEDRFLLPGLSDRYRSGEATFIKNTRNGGDAPFADLPTLTPRTTRFDPFRRNFPAFEK